MPSASLIAHMGASDDHGGTLDLVVRGGDPVTTARIGGRVVAEQDVELAGILGEDDDPNSVQPVVMSISAETLSSVGLQGDGETRVFTWNGEPAQTRIVGFSGERVGDGPYEVYTGAVQSGERGADFIAITDPVPVIVIGLVAVVGGCAALAGLSVIMMKLEARTNGFRTACREAGGFVTGTTPHLGVRFSLREHAFGCVVVPGKPDCVGLEGKSIVTSVETDRLDFDVLDEFAG